MIVSYVILHYKTLEVTIQCLKHLIISDPNCEKIVVDNGSNDGSGEKIKENFATVNNIKVIINKENLGFARGNNLGFEYVKKHIDGYTIVINSDVYITQPNFSRIIADYMSRNQIDVCGPDIITPNGGHQNPMLRQTFSTIRIIKQMSIDYIRYLMLKFHIFENKILQLYSNVTQQYRSGTVENIEVKNCVLHGSCVVFSQRWVENENFAFLPITFLYGEEMILYDYCQHKNYQTGVCPTAQVTHLGGTSSKNTLPERQKQLFVSRQMRKSRLQLIKQRIKYKLNRKETIKL